MATKAVKSISNEDAFLHQLGSGPMLRAQQVFVEREMGGRKGTWTDA